MAQEMQVVNTRGNTRDGGTRLNAFEYEQTLSGLSTGEAILIPSDISRLSVTLSFSGGAGGYVEATTDKVEKILTGTADYKQWPKGTVSTITQDSCFPPSGIRAVQTAAGILKMSLRGQ